MECNRFLTITDDPLFDGVKKCLEILRRQKAVENKDNKQPSTPQQGHCDF
jgi:hypothetical protein